MASNSITVKLTGPEKWRVFNNAFVQEAKTKLLWEHIDPNNPLKGQFMSKPAKPNPANYPKLLVRASSASSANNRPPAHSTRRAATTTPASSEDATPTGSQLPAAQSALGEEVDPRGNPAHVGEMTAAGRERFRQDTHDYQFDLRQYQIQYEHINELSAWIRKHVSQGLYDTCCDAEDSLDICNGRPRRSP